MKEAIIEGIFPTPIYFHKLNRKITPIELKFIEKNKKNIYKNIGNTTSNDNYVLNNKEFKSIKEELNLIIQDYFNKIILSSNDVTPYITQSWLNYTKKNEHHHRHQHQNSLVSGVFYINCDEKFDKIKFFKDYNYKNIQLETKEFNIWNSESWWFPVKTGDVILFPSSLSHMVETKEGTNTRISLAFNVFVKGKIGTNKILTELIL